MQGIQVDFNTALADGHLLVLRKRAPYVTLGESVNAYDEDGNEMQAEVAEINASRGLVTLVPNWDSFVSPGAHSDSSVSA